MTEASQGVRNFRIDICSKLVGIHAFWNGARGLRINGSVLDFSVAAEGIAAGLLPLLLVIRDRHDVNSTNCSGSPKSRICRICQGKLVKVLAQEKRTKL